MGYGDGHSGSSSGSTTSSSSTTQSSHSHSEGSDFNILAVEYYGAGICGIIAIFLTIHWSRFIYRKWGPEPGKTSIFTPVVSVSRIVRKFLFRSVPLFASAGHALVIVLFLAIQIVLCLVKLEMTSLQDWGKRTGWLCTVNMVFIVFLSMRNTPLGFLTGYTYERLQVLHRVGGYTTVAFAIIHLATYSAQYCYNGRQQKLLAQGIIMGMVAACAMFTMFILALVLRRRQYEIFYITHVCLFLASVITLGLHRPNWRTSVPQAAVVISCLWFTDRLIRWMRTLYNSINNSAVLYPVLDDGGEGTRIVFKKRLPGARPGQHCFVWIPRVRPFETHPFTIVANGPGGLELVANACGGFTRSLHNYATQTAAKSPSSPSPCTVWASVDGPYGVFPDMKSYDRVVLVAGGSGATFTFGLATHLVENLHPDSRQKIDFIWAVRKNDRLHWFGNHIDKLKSHDAHVEITVHITDDTPPSGLFSPSEHSLDEKDGSSAHTSPATHSLDDEKTAHNSSSSSNGEEKGMQECTVRDDVMYGIKNLRYEKLLVSQSIERIVSAVGANHRVLIAACGPAPLMDAVREAAADCIQAHGPSVDLHYESFEW